MNRCGTCKYFGAEIIGRRIKGKHLHECNRNKSIFIERTETSIGCPNYKAEIVASVGMQKGWKNEINN